jgi:hypothetical protein
MKIPDFHAHADEKKFFYRGKMAYFMRFTTEKLRRREGIYGSSPAQPRKNLSTIVRISFAGTLQIQSI